MSKSILQKFRKSLEQSSKIVYDSGANSHRVSPRRSQLETIKQYADKMQNEMSMPNLQESQKLLKRIPILVSQNDELREKVSQLQQEIRQKKFDKGIKQKKLNRVVKTQTNNEAQSRIPNYQSDGSTGSSLISGRLYESLRIGSRWDSLDRKHRAESTYYSHSMQKRADLANLQTEIVKFLQKKIDELKVQNNELLIKYNTALQARKKTCQEIDKIKENFELTLNKQIEVFKKKQDFYEQKLKNLEISIFKEGEQTKLLQLQNQALSMKVLDLQSALNKQKVTSKDLIVSYKNKCVWQKQNNILTEDINHLWKIKQQQFNNINNLLENLRIFKAK